MHYEKLIVRWTVSEKIIMCTKLFDNRGLILMEEVFSWHLVESNGCFQQDGARTLHIWRKTTSLFVEKYWWANHLVWLLVNFLWNSVKDIHCWGFKEAELTLFWVLEFLGSTIKTLFTKNKLQLCTFYRFSYFDKLAILKLDTR